MNKNNSRELCHWVGADVASKTFDASLVRYDQHFPATALAAIPVRTFQRTTKGVQGFLAWLDEQDLGGDSVRVVMESTGHYSTELAVWILAQRPSLCPAIANAFHTSSFIKSMGVRNKTDSLEARALGFYGVERQPIAYEPLTPERAELRELSRCRGDLVRQRTRLKNQMKRTTDSATVLSLQQEMLQRFKGDIKHIEDAMKTLVKKHGGLNHDIKLLSTTAGIAFISACTLIAELGDLRRFQRARQLTAFTGMSPRHHQSGTSINKRSTLCKQGNPRVRQTLYLCAMVAIRGDNQFRETYQHLIAQGKPKMVALIAIMRRLLIVLRAMLIKNQSFKPMGITCA
jgi:transposase